MNRLLLGVLGVVCLLNFSCRKENSEKVNQDEIWVGYRVVYRADLDSTFARVTFKHENKDGESLQLASKSSILIDEKAPVYDWAFAWYESRTEGLQTSVEFEYSDIDGNTFNNSVGITEVSELQLSFDTVYSDSAYYITWDGEPLASGEFVNAVFDGPLDRDLTVVTQDTVGANAIYIADTSLVSLPLGDISVHLERWNEVSINGTSAGARAYGHYISNKKTVKLVD